MEPIRAEAKGRKIWNREEQWIRFPNAFPALIDRPTFDAAQAERKRRLARPSDEEMLAPLRALLKRKGYLSIGLINKTKRVPSAASYLNRFGSMRRLYERAGYEPSNDYGWADVNKMLRLIQPSILTNVVSTLRAVKINAAPDSDNEVLIDGKTSLAIAMSRYRQPRDYARGWYAIEPNALQSDLILFVRTDEKNIGVADYYLFRFSDLVDMRYCLADLDRPKLKSHLCYDLSELPDRLSPSPFSNQDRQTIGTIAPIGLPV